MAEILKNNSFMALPSSIKRGNPAPLDVSEIWFSYEEMAAYAATNATAYVGQQMALVDEVNNTATAYIILNTDGDLQEIGAGVLTDDLSVAMDDEGALRLHDYGVKYYKYVAAVGEEGTEDYVAAHYEQQVVDADHPWVAGLEPRVVLEGEDLVLGWYEPNPTTVEGVQSQVVTVQSAVETLKSDVDQVEEDVKTLESNLADLADEIGSPAEGETLASGLYAELDAKANSANVYTKTEINDTVEGINNAIAEKADAADVYTKEDVYTKTETDTAIATAVNNADHLKRVILASPSGDQTVEDVINAWLTNNDLVSAADQYIYMIPTGLQQDDNKYYEYIILVEGENYVVEQVGNWEVDLSDYVSEKEFEDYLKSYYTSAQVDDILKAYATTAAVTEAIGDSLTNYYTIEQIDGFLDTIYTAAEVDALISPLATKQEVIDGLAGKVDNATLNNYYTQTEADGKFVAQEEGKSLVSDDEIAKLATVKENAEENYVKSVDDHFAVDADGKLSFVSKSIDISDVDNLEVELAKKFDTQYFLTTNEDGESVSVPGTLLSPTDAAKLKALVIGDNGVEISGKVNASNVEELDEWIVENRDSIDGLISEADQAKLDVLVDLIHSVSSEFTITEEKELQLASIAISKVDGLEEVLNAKALASDLIDLNTKVTNIEDALNDYVLKSVYNEKMAAIDADIALLKGATTWGQLSE